MSEPIVPKPAADRPGRALRIALAISVALNLVVLGVIGGAVLKTRQSPPMPVRELGFGPFTEALTRDQRQALRATFAAHAPDFRGIRREMRADADAVLVTLRADPFDPQAFSDQLAEMNEHATRRASDSEGILVQLVASMPQGDRISFADRLQTEMERFDRPPRAGDPPPPPPMDMPPPGPGPGPEPGPEPDPGQ